MVPMKVDDIAVSGEGGPFLVLLRAEDPQDGRVLPIVIDAMQALSIAAGRSEERPERPLTHDLILSLLQMLNAEAVEVQITELKGGTYFAYLIVERGGVRFDVDARPSDALAIAVRAKLPVLVAPEVLEASALEEDEGDAPQGSKGGVQA